MMVIILFNFVSYFVFAAVILCLILRKFDSSMQIGHNYLSGPLPIAYDLS